MFNASKFRDDYKEIAIDITGKRYTDYGMMWKDLTEMTRIPRSILERYDDWYILDDGFYYFKDRCKIEELFLSELARECKVRCVEFFLALDNGCLGIISKLYRRKDKKYYMYSDFCSEYFHHIPDYLGVFKLSSSIAFGNDKADILMDDVFDLIGFDMLTGQWDREEYNLFFECDSDSFRIASLCDNGVAFSSSFVYKSPFGNFNLKEEKVFRGNLPLILSNDIVFYNKLVSLLDIDIVKVLNRTIEKYRITVDEEDKKLLLSYFDNRKEAIDNTLKLSRKQ